MSKKVKYVVVLNQVFLGAVGQVVSSRSAKAGGVEMPGQIKKRMCPAYRRNEVTGLCFDLRLDPVAEQL